MNIFNLVLAISLVAGCCPKEEKEWVPKAGETVSTYYGTTEYTNYMTTLTKVIFVGKARCGTGYLVYSKELPGVDSAWVRPAL